MLNFGNWNRGNQYRQLIKTYNNIDCVVSLP